MTTPFHLPVTAAQVGTYFVGQYYNMLQTQPDFVHQFYNDASTMLRIDGNTRETASAMLQIHTLVMSLNYTGIEIKTAHSLESWNGGVLVMVSGSVHIKHFNGRRKFVQTFFLAPQEKGYFVLNDIFHFIEDDPINQHPVAYFAQSNLDSKVNTPTAIQEQVSNHMFGEDLQAAGFVAPANIHENGPVDTSSFPDEHLQQVPEAENILEDNFAVQANGSLQSIMNPLKDHLSPVEEPVGEPQKHTYASIVAKGQSATSVPRQPSFNKTTTASEWHHVPELSTHQQVAWPIALERSEAEAAEEVSAVEDEVEIKSVYVRNVPSSMSASEIGEEFKKFGRLKPDGVAIRTRKDIDVRYAFVEFEDTTGVQNAVEASTVQIAGHQLYIEGRRANRNNSFRGGRGRGRGSYQMDASRGRFGARSFGRGSGPDGDDRDYHRPRGNGFYRQGTRQDRVFSGNHQM